jgi:hypothetical protein
LIVHEQNVIGGVDAGMTESTTWMALPILGNSSLASP